MKQLTSSPAVALAALLVLTACQGTDPGPGGAEPAEAPAETPAHQVRAEISAEIHLQSADALLGVAQGWAEAVDGGQVSVTGGGGLAALIQGTAAMALSGRPASADERESARGAGVELTQHTVGYDVLAVWLHRSNRFSKSTLAQLAEIFGAAGELNRWSQLGIEMPGCDEIVRAGYPEGSETAAFFKAKVLGAERGWKEGWREVTSPEELFGLVRSTPCTVGYGAMAPVTRNLRVPCILPESGDDCADPSAQSAADGTYPLARPLYLYTQGTPTGAVAEYLDWILSDAGQCVVKAAGSTPVRKVDCGT